MKADVRFSEDGNKILLEMGTGEFIDFAKDLELAHRVVGNAQHDIEKFIKDLNADVYEELDDVAREKIVDSKRHEVEIIQKALDSMSEIVILTNQL